jgi:hypothetical protein
MVREPVGGTLPQATKYRVANPPYEQANDCASASVVFSHQPTSDSHAFCLISRSAVAQTLRTAVVCLEAEVLQV